MKNDKKKIVSIAGILFLVIFVVAISYAAFSYSKIGRENKITTGTISMNYTEANNGLTINEAVPTTDEEGKILISPGQVFDFTVSIDIVGDFQVSYEVVAEKQASSTLDEKYVKLYLERGLDGTNYSEIMEPSTYAGIEKASEFGAPTGSMIMDTGTVSSSTLYYYRLRMWLDESYELTSEAKSFTVKVNVYGTTEKYKLDNEGFACTFSDNDTLSVGNKSTVDLICTDQTSGVEKKQLAISDFVNSDSEVGEIKEISNPIKINGGYKYTLTLQGKKAGEFKLTLPEGKISDKLGNKNTEQSKTYNVSNTIYRITYKIGKNVETIEKESDSCIVNADGKCEVTLPSITPKAGYTSLGWSTEENSDTEGYKENTKYEVTSSTVLYAHAKDITAPKVVMEIEGDEQYDQNKEVKVDIVEEAGEISDDGTVTYGWSTSRDIEPTTWTTVTFAEMEKTTGKYTFKATATDLTGEYYLFVKANLKDSVGNISNETKISTSTFKFDNVKPICKITGDNTIMVEEAKELTLTCTDENSKVVAKDLDISNIEISNDTGKILSISSATTTENGYKYQIKLKGLTTGSFNVSLKAGIISDSAGNKNEKVTSETIEVTGRTYTATYQKGNNIESISRESDTCTTTGSNTSCEITLPEIVASVGYSPVGWYNEDKSKQTAPNAKYTLTKDETLTAEAVVNSYKVTYDYMTNGGNAVSQKEDKVNYNSAVDLNVTATKDGWTFVGWNTDKDATTALTSLKMGTEDVTLYAIFKKEVTATFDYYDSGLKNATTSCVMYNNETICNYEIPTAVTSSVGPNETVYKGLSSKASSSELTTTYNSNTTKYYAVYDVIKSATYYYYNGTAQTSATASGTRTALSDGTTYKITEGEITIPEVVTSSTGPSNATYSGIASVINQTTSASSTTAISTYYAYYSGKWNIRYAKGAGVNAIGSTGTTCDSNKVSNGTNYLETSCEVTLPEITAEVGYTVTGWYDNTTKVGTANEKYQVTKDVTLTAQTNINAYAVTYDYATNGGSSATKTSATVNYNSTIDLSVTATKDGWTFVGWNTDKDATTALTSLKMGTANVVLYAIYRKEAVVLTANFDANGATLSATTKTCTLAAVYNNNNQQTSCSITAPTITRANYTILGYNTIVSATTATVQNSGTITLTTANNNSKWYAITTKALSSLTVTLSDTTYTYDGSEKKPTVTVKDGSVTLTNNTDYTVTYSNNTNVGTATVKVTAKNVYNSTGKTVYTGTVDKTFTITKAASTISFTSTGGTYSGSAIAAVAKGTGTITYAYYTNNTCTTSASSVIDAATYYVKATSAGDSNHTGATTACTAHKINPKSIAVTWGSTTTFTYNGSAQAPTITTPVSGVTGESISLTRTTQTNANQESNPTYTSTASIASVTGGRATAANYKLTGNTKSFVINKANATNPTLTAYTGTYNGSSHTIGVSGGSGGTIQYSTDNSTWSTTKPTRTTAGTTTVYVRVLGDSNHNTTSSINAKITINKATPTVTLSATTGTATNAAPSVTFTEKASIAGSFSNTSGTTSVATVTPASYTSVAANTAKTVTVAGVGTGKSTISAKFTPTDTANYATVTKTYTVTSDITLPKWSLVSATTETTSKTATPLEIITLKIKGTDDSGSSTSTLTNDNIKVYINGSLVTPSNKGISATAGITGGKEYTILISGINSAGSMTVIIDAGTLTDAVGNVSTEASITTGITIRKYTASEVTYSGTSSGSSCTSVQCALDEISKKVS